MAMVAQNQRPELSEFSIEDTIWAPEDGNCWVKGTITSIEEDNVTINLEDGHVKTLKLNSILPRNPTLADERIDDLTGLAHLHEASVLNALKCRYDEGEIYTYSGIVLVAINPYRQLPIYNREIIWAYNGQSRDELAPHLFAVVEEAYQSLKQDNQSQSIIVSGESGAGKTISAKFIMRYLAELCVQGSPYLATSEDPLLLLKEPKLVSLEEKVLATNPILEAFGNAKTVKNDNSSRFGKYIQIFFDYKECTIRGATVRSYLLEKTRVVSQANMERNFHIFYQLLKGCPPSEQNAFGLDGSNEFRYLSNGLASTIDGIDDAKEFELTRKALELAGFTEEHQWNIFRLLMAILYLGNITFINGEDGYARLAEQDSALERSATLLGITLTALSDALLKRIISAAHETVETFNTVLQAETTRDGFAKHLYAHLFDHIIDYLNQHSLAPSTSDNVESMRFIGVLDIYGFEKFQSNSFEQFCINYANEKLQSMFNMHVFDLEQQLYSDEGILWSFINFVDNRPCIELIESKMGIFDLLDEECRFPNGSDASFVNKLLEAHNRADKISDYLDHNKLSNAATFIVKHFAYDVEYSAEHFLEKNRDHLTPETFISLASRSSDPFLQSLFEQTATSQPDSRKNSGLATPYKAFSKETLTIAPKQSTGSLFRQNLKELMGILYSTKVHYIRCIKPNEGKEPFHFDPPFVLQQLRACGIIETIRISASGYPGRWSFENFVDRFSILSVNPIQIRQFDDARKACQALVQNLDLAHEAFQVGHTKIFMRTGILAELEKARTRKLNYCASEIQKVVRRLISKKQLSQMLYSVALINRMSRLTLSKSLFETLKIKKSALIMIINFRTFESKKKVFKWKHGIQMIQSIFIAFRSRQNLASIINERLAQLAITHLKAFKARLLYTRAVYIAILLQCWYRQSVSWASLGKLREEARSYERLKNSSERKDSHIAELEHQLELTKEHLAYEKAINQSLAEKLQKFEQETVNKSNNLKEQNTKVQHKLQEQVSSHQRLISQLEATNKELFKRNEELVKDLGILKLERTNAEALSSSPSSSSFQRPSLANIIIRQTVTPPKTIKHLRSISFDSKLSHLTQLNLPSITRPSTIQFQPGDKLREICIALNNSLCLTELIQVVKEAKPFTENDFVPSHILSLWITSWLQANSDNTTIQTNLNQVINQIKVTLMSNADSKRSLIDIYKDSRPWDADGKFAFWLANLFDFLCFLQYAVVDTMEHQADPALGPTEQMLVLMQLRTDVARVVEDLCRIWLTDLFRSIVRMGVAALLDYQGLSGFSSDQNSPVIDGKPPFQTSSLKFLIFPFSRFSTSQSSSLGTSGEPSIEDFIAALNRLTGAMEKAHLPPELAMQIMSAVLGNIASSSFNQLVLRKNYATWKRGLQIQYNISRLEEWATSLNIAHPQYFFSSSALASPLGSLATSPHPSTNLTNDDLITEAVRYSSTSPLLCIEPLVQAVKLLQLAKTRAANDVDTLIAACPRLSLAQIRKILSIYVPDAYEDGPVAPIVLQTLTKRLAFLPKADLTETLAESQPQVLPLQLSIKPIPPVPFSEIPTDSVPAHLWKIFALLNRKQAPLGSEDKV